MKAAFQHTHHRDARGVRTDGARWFVLGLIGLLPAAAGAQQQQQQRDSVRVTIVRAVTPFEMQVERLSRMLVGQRQEWLRLAGRKQQLEVSLQATELPGGERQDLVTRLRTVDAQLASLDAARASLRGQLEALCTPARQPDGWMGINFNGDYLVNLSNTGAQLYRFKGYPSIESVEPNSPAEKAGIRRGDQLLTLGGRDLTDAEVVFRELLKPGLRLPLRLKRGVETRTVSVVIEPRPSDFQMPCVWEDDVIASALAPFPGALRVKIAPPGTAPARVNSFTYETRPGQQPRVAVEPGDQGARQVFVFAGAPGFWAAGAQLADLNEDLARLVGAERGVFVVDVARRSPAALSGLRGGDVIVSADGQAVFSPAALRQLIADRADTKELRLQVIRLRKSEPVMVVLKW